MAETKETNFISKVNLKGTTYNIKDAKATTAINDAKSQISSVQTSVTNLTNKVNANTTAIANLKKLSRLTASYDSTTETLNITEGTHA